jgi:hypothetical protein
MSGLVTLSLPSASAERLGLPPSKDGLYRLSWIELTYRLSQATSQGQVADIETVRRALTSLWYARAAARAVLARPDWSALAWEAGLRTIFEDGDEITRETAACFLECFYLVVFAQPERFRDLSSRSARPEHVAGWAFVLSAGEIENLAYAADERERKAVIDGWQPSMMAGALNLYLRLLGQIQEPEPEPTPEAEPLVIALPARAEKIAST